MIGAMLVEDIRVEALTAHFGAIVAKRFLDIHWQAGFEIHGSAVFGGTGLFKAVFPIERLGACHDIFDHLVAAETPIVWTAIDEMKIFASEHPHTMAFRFLAERPEDHLRPNNILGSIVADGNNEMEQKVLDDLMRYELFNTGRGIVQRRSLELSTRFIFFSRRTIWEFRSLTWSHGLSTRRCDFAIKSTLTF